MKLAFACLIALISIVAAPSASACSMAGCSDRGVEMSRNFEVIIHHGDEPLLGAKIEIIGPQSAGDTNRFMAETDVNGVARITNLAPGDYWLDAEYLHIGAAYHCFHVNEKPSQQANLELTYDWGDLALSVRRIAGRMVNSQLGKGGNPLQNLLHRVDVPIVGAHLTLQNATTRDVYRTTSDTTGAFAFDAIPDGTYVLHVDAGKVELDRAYEESDHVIKLDSTAGSSSLVVMYREPGGGACGGASVELQGSSKYS